MISSLQTYAAQCLSHLNLSLPSDLNAPEIEERLQRFSLAEGKRIRPILCFAFGEVFGVEHERLADFARIAEFTHAATLLHDDVIDQATERRAKPSLNAILGNTRAVLAGDSLIARIMLEMAELNQPLLLKELAKSVDDLTRGEWLQLELKHKTKAEYKTLLRIAELKTSSLIRWSCLVGPVLSMNASSFEVIKDFSRELGLLFQFTDDRLDFMSQETTGKPSFNDLKEGQINLVSHLLIQKNPNLIQRIQDAWLNGSQSFHFMFAEFKLHEREIQTKVNILRENCFELLRIILGKHESNAIKVIEEIINAISRRSK